MKNTKRPKKIHVWQIKIGRRDRKEYFVVRVLINKKNSRTKEKMVEVVSRLI